MQRSAPPNRSGSKTGALFSDLSGTQLQKIGAIALEWNEVEFALDCALYSGLNLGGDSWTQVLTRISTDEKLDLLRDVAATLKFTEDIKRLFAVSVGQAREVKALRNGVIHSRIYDAPAGIGESLKKGGKINQVLLSESALSWLLERIQVLRQQVSSITALFDLHRSGLQSIKIGIYSDGALSEISEVRHFSKELEESIKSQSDLASTAPNFK